MRNAHGYRTWLCLVGLTLWTLTAGGQVMQLTQWDLPATNASPYGIALAPDGKVYFTEFNLNRIGQLDPVANEIRERQVGEGPAGLVLGDTGAVYFTLSQENALELLVFIGGGAKWSLPTPGAWPEVLVAAPTGPGKVNLWLNERNSSKIARFAPAQVFVTLPLILSPPQPITPIVTEISPTITSVSPELYPGNPLLPPPIALLVPATNGPFTEWQSMITDCYLERVAVAPDGRVWFTQGVAPISVLDPETNTALVYGIPGGTSALGIVVGPDGKVWFTDTLRPAIGVLDPATADVRLWPIPDGRQPFALALDAEGNVWFTDREADAVGCLSPARSEIALYGLPAGTHPLFLALDEAGSVWFTAERGNFVGKLSIVPVLGPPPTLPTAGAFQFLSYGLSQIGNRASGTVTFLYDGSAGLPVWISTEVLRSGVALPGFVAPPVRIDGAGAGTAAITVEYRGTTPTTSDEVRFFVSLSPGGPALAEQRISFSTTWTP
ncbi:MAG: hypothetical protein Kow0097_04900 [Candidatus Bipolaricaulota bacterium]|nr:hypothetical protein [Candidatus Bipolaricaulota bacterium]